MPLQVTVTPDITVDDNTLVDASVLNRLGSPAVDIRGTIDGTSGLSISAGSVTNSMLANMTGPTVKGKDTGTGAPEDLAIDGSLDIAAGSPGTLKVKALGIDTGHLANNAVTTAKITDLNVTQEKIEAQAASSLLGNPGTTAAVPEVITLGQGLSFQTTSLVSTLTRSRTSGVSTIVTSSAHGLSTGDEVNLTGFSDSSFVAYHVAVTVVNSNTFTYPQAGLSDSGSTGDTSGRVRKINTSTLRATSTAVAYTTQLNANSDAVYDYFHTLGGTEMNWGDDMLVFLSDDAPYTEFSVSITPTSASSKLLVEFECIAHNGSADEAHWGYLALYRDPDNDADTPVAWQAAQLDDGCWDRVRCIAVVDSTATTATTFKVKYGTWSAGAGSVQWNREAVNENLPLPQAIFRVTEI